MIEKYRNNTALDNFFKTYINTAKKKPKIQDKSCLQWKNK